MHKIDPVITRGTVHGSCPKCGEPYMGQMDADDQHINMECINCHHKGTYTFVWPDDLPKVKMKNYTHKET